VQFLLLNFLIYLYTYNVQEPRPKFINEITVFGNSTVITLIVTYCIISGNTHHSRTVFVLIKIEMKKGRIRAIRFLTNLIR